MRHGFFAGDFLFRIHSGDKEKQRWVEDFFYEGEKENRLRDVVKTHKGGSIYVVIGPEGGFSVDEAETIKKRVLFP